MADGETEIALCQAYCVVYRLEPGPKAEGEEKANKEWVCQHTGWAQVNLYEDITDKTYRIVGWTLPEGDAPGNDDDPLAETKILVNSNVTNNCTYSKKSVDFLKYVDEDRVTYGFGFYKKDGVENHAVENPQRFYDCLTAMIDRLKDEFGGEDDEDTRLAFHGRTAKEGKNTIKFTQVGAKDAQGSLAIHAPAGAKHTNASENVSEAKDVKHVHSVRFDPKTRSYVGLPKEWEGLMNQQFGLDMSQVECVRTAPYKSRIPAVLVQMLAYMRKEKAFEIEGLFRVAAGSEECSFVKGQLNNNTFTKCDDINCISTLTKVWFRDLPKPLLDCVTHYKIVECTSTEGAGEIVEKMPEPEGSIMLWLVDLCVECTLKSSINKMTPTNLGIVIGPNLFRISMVDPMASLQYSQKVAQFLSKAIVWRANSKGHMEIKDSGPAKANAIEKTF